MKLFLTILFVFISSKVFCQAKEIVLKDSIQEGTIYYFDLRKHMCGQLYYIAIEKDTITVDKLLNLKIDLKEIPVEVYFTIHGNGRCGSKTLTYIERK